MKRYSALTDYLDIVAHNRSLLQRVFFAGVLFIFICNYFAGLFISQIGSNPVLYQEIDPAYWLLMLLRVPRFIAGNKLVAFCFDGLLVLSALVSFIKPSQAGSVRVFWGVYFFYFMIFNLLSGHHYANTGIMALAFPFMFKRGTFFPLLYAAARYYFLFIFSSAALWKIGRGSLFHREELMSILQGKNAMTLINHRSSFTDQIAFYIGTHPEIAVAAWVILGILELSFIIGFFSFRYDHIPFISYLLFATGGYLIVGIFNIENILLLMTLFPVVKWVAGGYQKITGSKKLEAV